MATGQVITQGLSTELTSDQQDSIGRSLIQILQDINLYMKYNRNVGEPKKIVLKLDQQHFVSITCKNHFIIASMVPIETKVSEPPILRLSPKKAAYVAIAKPRPASSMISAYFRKCINAIKVSLTCRRSSSWSCRSAPSPSIQSCTRLTMPYTNVARSQTIEDLKLNDSLHASSLEPRIWPNKPQIDKPQIKYVVNSQVGITMRGRDATTNTNHLMRRYGAQLTVYSFLSREKAQMMQ